MGNNVIWQDLIMNKLLLTPIIAAAVFIASPALAADAVEYEQAPVAASVGAYDWSGAYVGAHVGYGWGDSTWEFTGGDFSPMDPDGWSAGLFAGMNFSGGNRLIYGVDANIDYSNMSGGSVYFNAAGVPFAATDRAEAQVNWTGAIRGRIGIATGKLLPFVSGGLAVADVDFNRLTPGTPRSNSETMAGWTAGAGVDFALGNMSLLRFEYRYNDYGSKSYTDPVLVNYNIDLKTQEVKFGFARKF